MNYLSNATIYLIENLLGLILYIVLIRFWMQWVKANFRNPVGQFIITVTNPIVLPLRRLLPSFGSIDTATVVLAIALAIFKTFTLLAIAGYSIPVLKLITYSLGAVIESSIYIFMAAIFIQIIASWVNPYSQHPILEIARSIAEPLMAPARRLIPAIAGIDFSPFLVFIFLNLSLQLIVAPLQNL